MPLVSNLQEAKERATQFVQIGRDEPESLEELNNYFNWFYFKGLNGFAPAKYIGNIDNVDREGGGPAKGKLIKLGFKKIEPEKYPTAYSQWINVLGDYLEKLGGRINPRVKSKDGGIFLLNDEFDSLISLQGPRGDPSRPSDGDLESLADKLFLPPDFLHEISHLLKDKRQIIFQGPPGTGKTYLAREFAECLAGSSDRVNLVQFHPSYAYEDFVQGFRPTLQDGKAGFVLSDGPLLLAAKNAVREPDAMHFLIIDEINRGRLANVFGELYFLLEYRGEEIRLQYERDRLFALPDNLYIIGTMNTADRSIALVDLALRRRFYFISFDPHEEPIDELLYRWLAQNAPGMEWLADVVSMANQKLPVRSAAIGPSYFMKDGLDENMAERIWKHSVMPYIEECLVGEGDSLKDFEWNALLEEQYGEEAAENQLDDESASEGATEEAGEGS